MALGRRLSSLPSRSNISAGRHGASLVNNGIKESKMSTSRQVDEPLIDCDLPSCSKELGAPLPFDEHACSVSLPTWCSVVGYEEGDKETVLALKTGYPRFVYHTYVLQLMEVVLEMFPNEKGYEEDCLVLPTREAALRCQAFLRLSLEENQIGNAFFSGSDPSNHIDNALIERTESPPSSTTEEPSSLHSRIRVASIEEADVHAVLFPAETTAGTDAKAYWQHTGELVSSRRAEKALNILGKNFSQRVTCCPIQGTPAVLHSCDPSNDSYSASNGVSYHRQLQESISSWTNVDTDNIFLVPSGMATIYKSLRSARRYQLQKDPSSLGGTSIVYGFPYLDTLKMCSRREFSPAGVEFFGKGDENDLKLLQKIVKEREESSWSAVFTEVPSNPLLQCPDLEALRMLADEHDFCVVVDDTIGNFLNVDLLESGLADAVCTSLTKLVSGRGDAIAGSVITNPNTEKGRWMRDDMAKDTDAFGGLHEADALAMVHNSVDFPERNAQINETTERLAEFMKNHPDVETVWYPKFVAPLFTNYQHKDGGFGGLFSIHLDSHICQRTFYDVLDVAKGPSLGTNFTLVCPYTLLAHYHELDFALSHKVPPNLIRIAVGLEDYDELEEKFAYALDRSRLHPKLPT